VGACDGFDALWRGGEIVPTVAAGGDDGIVAAWQTGLAGDLAD
jgi:hypothetical protein